MMSEKSHFKKSYILFHSIYITLSKRQNRKWRTDNHITGLKNKGRGRREVGVAIKRQQKGFFLGGDENVLYLDCVIVSILV